MWERDGVRLAGGSADGVFTVQDIQKSGTTLAWQLTTEEKLGPRLTSLYEVSGMRFMYTDKSIASTFAEKKNCAKIC